MSDDGQLVVPAEAPYFEGHFPGDPIMPAVVILELVIDAIARSRDDMQRPRALQSAKFLAPVRPGDTLAIDVEQHRTALRFSCRVGSRIVAVGTLTPREG